jgi:hypothetical protein
MMLSVGRDSLYASLIKRLQRFVQPESRKRGAGIMVAAKRQSASPETGSRCSKRLRHVPRY